MNERFPGSSEPPTGWPPNWRVEVSPRPVSYQPPPPRQRPRLVVGLFLATCGSTLLVGGPLFSLAVMTILLAHELGHFLQARRYQVPVSLPYFLPFPLSPIGTLGAVIVMRGHVANVRALYDIAITGPLAGLVPTLMCLVVGLPSSTVQPLPDDGGLYLEFGEPLLFTWLSGIYFGPIPEGHALILHPIAFAGWVGVFLTALNLIPIGQLDGGHILYALLKRRAHAVASMLLGGAIVGTIVYGYWWWSLMIVLLIVFGARHPPTADDTVPLGWQRIVLGWLTLAFVIIGFTPVPWLPVGLE
ncbi:MAG: site-2 protease family protein [Acidobacteriota bacterium]